MSKRLVTIDYIDQGGLFTDYDKAKGHPKGWTLDAVKRISTDIQEEGKSGSGLDNYKEERFTSEERAAYDYYELIQRDPDRIHKAVEEAEKRAKKESSEYAAFDDEKNYIDKPESSFDPPSVKKYGDPDGKSHNLAVNTAALEHFARQIDKVVGDGTGMVLDAKKLVDLVDILPGGFGKAEVLRQKIVGAAAGDAGLRGETMALLQAVHDALYQLKLTIRKLIKEYDSTEELNELDADRLNKVMDKAWGKIGDIKSHGQSKGSTESV